MDFHKRRGMSGKLAMYLNRAPKPSVQYNTKADPSPPPSSASLNFLPGDDHEFVVANSAPPPNFKASSSFVKVERGADLGGYRDKSVASEVDRRAASYISSVQERFRLERVHG